MRYYLGLILLLPSLAFAEYGDVKMNLALPGMGECSFRSGLHNGSIDAHLDRRYNYRFAENCPPRLRSAARSAYRRAYAYYSFNHYSTELSGPMHVGCDERSAFKRGEMDRAFRHHRQRHYARLCPAHLRASVNHAYALGYQR